MTPIALLKWDLQVNMWKIWNANGRLSSEARYPFYWLDDIAAGRA